MPINVTEAGRKGGFATLKRRGHQFYCDIGRKGQKAMRARYPKSASEWGKRGGRPRKPNLGDMGK